MISNFLKHSRYLYPGIVSFVISAITFPLGLGRYMAGELNTYGQVTGLFANCTWTNTNLTVREVEIVRHWSTEQTDVFVGLASFTVYTFVFSIIASTLPVPSGSFIPVFKIGAAIGRIAGELMHLTFPLGIRYGGPITPIIPGGYAMVGAAAFSGAVTHTISVSVIVFEMTGQITHIIPIMIAVLISNAIASLLQPSCYDSIIVIKKLPYLPDLLPSGSGMYNIYVDSFMVRDVIFITKNMSYKQLNKVLTTNRNLRSIPLVDNPDSMILLGSIQRRELLRMIERHIGRRRRQQVAAKWHKEAQEKAIEEFERRMLQESLRRRPSRFEVLPAPDMLLSPQVNNPQFTPVFIGQPKKSILKKSNSFICRSFNSLVSPTNTQYSTVTGAGDSRIRMAFTSIFNKSSAIQDSTKSDLNNATSSSPDIPVSPRSNKKVTLPRDHLVDMSTEDQKRWEKEEMALSVDFDKCHIDPAPFQLVEKTSLLKVHSLFSMVGVNHAYVTAIGRLIGVVGLKELRKGIEDSHSGNLPVDPDDSEESSRGETTGEPLLSHPLAQVTVISTESDNYSAISDIDTNEDSDYK